MKKALALFLMILAAGLVSCASTHKDIKQESGAGPAAGKASGKSGDALSLMEAIEQSAEKIAKTLPRGSRVAIVAFESENDNLSNFIMNEFTGAITDRGVEVADRRNLEYLITELQFQMSGMVDDDQIKRVGSFLAADLVITGQLLLAGNTYRYHINATDVEEGTSAGVIRQYVRNDAEMRDLAASLANRRASVKAATYGEGQGKTSGSSLDCGILFLNRKNYEMSISCFTEAIMRDPDMAAAYFYRGQVHAQTGDFQKAIKDYDEAIRLNPGLAEMYYYRAIAYSELRGQRREQQLGYQQKAVDDLNEAIRLNPNYVEAYILRGRVYFYQAGDIDKAAADFDRAITLNPNDLRQHNLRGHTYYKKKEFDKAIADYTAAIKLNPDDTASYSNRIDAYLKKGDLDKAITDYGQLVRLNPDSTAPYSRRIELYIKKGDFGSTIADYDQLMRLMPEHNHSHLYQGRANAYYEMGVFDKAISDYSDAIRLYRQPFGGPGLLYFERGHAYRKKGDIEKALDDYKEAQRIFPNRNDIRQTLEAVLKQGPATAQAPDTRWYTANPNAAAFAISTANELAGLAQIVNGTWGGKPAKDSFNGKTVKLTKSINLSGYDNWIPVGGARENSFSGTFNGDGKVISNLTIKNRDKSGNGLFGLIEGGKVENLGLEGVSISSGNSVGGIAVAVSKKGSIVNSYTTGDISGYGSVGGIAGSLNDSSQIIGSYSSATVSGGRNIGGIVGTPNNHSRIINSYSTGAISGVGRGEGNDVGGIAGRAGRGVAIINCYSTGPIKGSDDVGGIAGYLADKSNISGSYSTGTVNGNTIVGGLVGLLRGSLITNSYSTAAVSGQRFTGGIAGDIWEKGELANCVALNSEVNGLDPHAVGRIVGRQTNTQSNNAALAQMKNRAGNTDWKNKGGDKMDGADINPAEIKAGGTIGGRFKAAGDGWTIENGKLPGLGGNAVAMPPHLAEAR